MNMNAMASNVKEALHYYNFVEVKTSVNTEDTSIGGIIVRWGTSDHAVFTLDLTLTMYTKHAKVVWVETGLAGCSYTVLKDIIKAVEKKID